MTIFFLFVFIYIMVNFQNKNKVWINNTLKSNAETLDILKLLKDIGIFKEKPKKRKPKSKEEEQVMEDTGDEFLAPPSGGGGGAGGSVSAVPPSSQVTQALQAIKSGASSNAQQQYLLERAKEENQLALGKLRDAQQDYSQQQTRRGFGYSPNKDLTVSWIDEPNDAFFPPKESVVSEPSQEFQQETSGTNVPEDVMDIDVSEKVSSEQGQFEDEEQQTFTATGPPLQPFPLQVDYDQAFPVISKQYSVNINNLKPDSLNKLTNKQLKELIIQLADTLGYVKPTYLAGQNNSTLQQRLKKMVIQKYKEDFEETL